MSHPRNRLERRVIGYCHGVRRSYGYWPEGTRVFNISAGTRLPEEKMKEWRDRHIGLLKDTTKLCSCSMCGNPRRADYSKGKSRLTMPERKALDKDRFDLESSGGLAG
jgi:hypothetical protein